MISKASFLKEIEDQQFLEDDRIKKDILKLFLSTMSSFGFEKSFQALQLESGVYLESEIENKLKRNIQQGEWDQSLDLLEQLGLKIENLDYTRFLIYEQQFLESLFEKKVEISLQILRNKIQPLNLPQNEQKIYQLSTFLIQTDFEKIKQQLNWEKGESSRKTLINQIFEFIEIQTKDKICTPHRLQTLLKQSILYQIIHNCEHHYQIPQDFSLIQSHQCTNYNQKPFEISQVLQDHTNEVWLLKFSPDGNYMISVANDQQMILWKFVNNLLIQKCQKKQAHTEIINNINWKQDSQQLGSASQDKEVKIWNQDLDLLFVLKGHLQSVQSILWHPRSFQILTGGKDNFILIWNEKGKKQQQINSFSSQDLLITSEGSKLISLSGNESNIIQIFDTEKKSEIHTIHEQDQLISGSLSTDDKYFIVNVGFKDPEIHLWSLDSFELLNCFKNFYQEKFILRCALGWQNDLFVSCGSEDGIIHIWHQFSKKNQHLQISTGTNKAVNTISWHPQQKGMFAVGLDDFSVQIWKDSTVNVDFNQLSKIENNHSNHKNTQTPKKFFNYFIDFFNNLKNKATTKK